MNGWTAVGDRLPDHGGNVLVLLDIGQPTVGRWVPSSERWFSDWSPGPEPPIITHWQPLPPPPGTPTDAAPGEGGIIFQYDGPAYVRPMGRGVTLSDTEYNDDLADVLNDARSDAGEYPDGDVHLTVVARIRARVLRGESE